MPIVWLVPTELVISSKKRGKSTGSSTSDMNKLLYNYVALIIYILSMCTISY